MIVLDAATGERHPVWTELDSTATTAASTAIVIHPMVNFEPAAKYIVVLRNLKDALGTVLKAPAGFRYYRDFLHSKPAEDQPAPLFTTRTSSRSFARRRQAVQPLPRLGLHGRL